MWCCRVPCAEWKSRTSKLGSRSWNGLPRHRNRDGNDEMSTRQTWRRLARVQQLVCPKHHDGLLTLEELCRAIWRQDQEWYRKMADGEYGSLRFFIRQFEQEG